MAKQEIRFGIIGCGLMGREFASAAARWCHLLDQDVIPQIVGVCDPNPKARSWFEDNFSKITLSTGDYQDLLDSREIDAIYCSVPHDLHQQIYVDVIRAGKHLLGEKPFGIDLAANESILKAVQDHPQVLVRCASEFPFFPGAQAVFLAASEGRMGTIIDVQAGFLHSSDLDPRKPINWKRRVATNGEYGCMGDLGMHVLHIPLRLGWFPRNIRAILTRLITERPDASGTLVPTETWDNALMNCEVVTPDQRFPMTLETKRIAPGETNTWFIKITGTQYSAEFSTKYPKTLRSLAYSPGNAQAWQTQELGSAAPYRTITGEIFEFGFSDSILQMWAAFCDELAQGEKMRQPFRCVTPQETHQSHLLFTAALASNAAARTMELADER